MNNIITVQNYYLRWELEREIQTMRDMVKKQTLHQRRRKNLGLPPLEKDVIKPVILRESVSWFLN